MLALSVRARCDRLNGTMHEVYRCLLGIRLASRMLKTRCRLLAWLDRAVGGALLAEECSEEVSKLLRTWALLQHGHCARHVVRPRVLDGHRLVTVRRRYLVYDLMLGQAVAHLTRAERW